jgi:hypothetical protein
MVLDGEQDVDQVVRAVRHSRRMGARLLRVLGSSRLAIVGVHHVGLRRATRMGGAQLEDQRAEPHRELMQLFRFTISVLIVPLLKLSSDLILLHVVGIKKAMIQKHEINTRVENAFIQAFRIVFL